MYIQSLRSTGTAFRKFVEPEAHTEPFLHPSRSATPEPLALMEKSLSQMSFSSPSISRRQNATDAFSPSPSPPSSITYRANHTKVTGSYSTKVSEKIPSPVTGRVVFSCVPQNNKPPSMESAGVSSFPDPPVAPETPLWDFFGLSHPIDNQFSSEEVKGTDQHFDRARDISRFQEEEGIPELEDVQRSVSSGGSEPLSSCFSCGQDPQPAQEEPALAEVKNLTWHRTTSSRSASSGNLLGLNPKDDVQELHGRSYVENSCMISGSHASTLDRLYAWERKLYDEVKPTQEIRRDYDSKCKLLRLLESKKSSTSIEKTRAVVKELHSRIKVAIHRIDSISQRIEEIRDRELQPQLEELIEGLSRMWEVMSECHKLQFKIISVAYCSSSTRIPRQSESHKEIVLQLENELKSLSSSFAKWIGAQKSYLQSINEWLFKCVSLEEMTSKRKKRWHPQPKDKVKRYGAPIYTTCIDWLEVLEKLPEKEVTDSIKGLAAEVRRFLPRQEKNQGKGSDAASRDDASEDSPASVDRVRSSMVVLLDKLNKYAESSVKEYAWLEKTILESKNKYDKLKGTML
ncbi:hypothetical protein MLD38_017204 [Melastoma candidum]|uniref:Uncharacterized protein n=1 Tax=Melastoma candidum TaxID=119954 RepID=A0ACB9QP36_9MYRT|nr:hypothetical protein MLD38_017204 [Melastoma candidum]